ncbi:VWA domain-containing protein [Methylomonas paludis]|uniref:VWA domain-containing protein n=1 Tax=Methylomonas paludis TaxID=1173101 RepID=A0A975R9E3_9GAMM|nr:vWA domain-containing protein [Methylomonas paludis]QWF70144.1 VWA domain-containing protein [Methylomonas paludis]
MTLYPSQRQTQSVPKLMLIVDITRSMNSEDYQLADKPVSRLEFVKHSLRKVLSRLPCQSQVGLGVFTERRVNILFQPIEVCQAYAELDHSIAALDWRMAWAADSRICSGLLNSMQQLLGTNTALVFISDGQEAPPLNLRYRSDFSELKGKVKGIIIGSGGLRAVAIPKFNNSGQRTGNYGPDDVPQRSTFGESDLNPEKIDGYDARNAPFGRAAVQGNEHLSALQEPYLQSLAAETGLAYQRLTNSADLQRVLQAPELGILTEVEADIRWYYVLTVLILVLLLFI